MIILPEKKRFSFAVKKYMNVFFMGERLSKMSRPTNKEELLKAAEETFDKLKPMISTDIAFDGAIAEAGKEAHWSRDKNVRDVLVHLYEWHVLLLNWFESNMNAVSQPFLPEQYNWKNYGEMNIEFCRKHQNTTFEEAQKLLFDSHKKIIKLIKNLSNDELFEKKHFKWTGTTSIGAYCISATSAHYDWAIKKLKTNEKLSR
jgi:hypothetical protein